jgi:hypothetical protein
MNSSKLESVMRKRWEEESRFNSISIEVAILAIDPKGPLAARDLA